MYTEEFHIPRLPGSPSSKNNDNQLTRASLPISQLQSAGSNRSSHNNPQLNDRHSQLLSHRIYWLLPAQPSGNLDIFIICLRSGRNVQSLVGYELRFTIHTNKNKVLCFFFLIEIQGETLSSDKCSGLCQISLPCKRIWEEE